MDTDPISELLQQVLERPEEQWEQGIADLCATRVASADEIRRRFGLLRMSGFLAIEPATPPDEVPDRLGEFELLERLGQGGMGVVYAARQARLDRTVALKLVRPEHLYFQGARERFQREIAAVAKLSHPGIVSVFTVGDDQRVPYFAMELLRGQSLDEVLQGLAGRRAESLAGADLAAAVAASSGVVAASLDDPLFRGPWPTVCAGIARRLAEALAHAHQHGVLHRDVKPSNVMVTPEGRVVLLDFGLAWPAGSDRMTREGSHVGSLPYMAPEQLRGEAGDARTDVYGLGVLLRELLTLRQPFLSPSGETTRQRILQGEGEPVAAGNRAASWELATVCAMATEPDPRRRYATALDFAHDLDHVLQRRPIRARPAGPLRRLLRWAQRRPAVATGLLVTTLAAIGTPTAIAIGIAGQRDRARAAEALETQRSYEANLAAANAALQARDGSEVRRRLAACPEALRGFEWHHLELAVDASLLTLRGHEAAVRAVALTLDATRLASGGDDGRVRLWDLATGMTLHEFAHHRDGIEQLEFTIDGRRLLVHDQSGHTSVLDVAGRSVLAERPRASVHEQVAIGNDAASVTVSQGGWRLLDLDPETLLPRREVQLERRGMPPRSRIVADRRHLVSVSGGDLHVWDLASGRLCGTVARLASEGIHALSLSAAGDRLAFCDRSGRVVVSAVPGGEVIQTVTDRGDLSDVVFDRKGERVAAVGADGAVRTWEVDSGRLLAVQSGHEGAVHAVAFAGSRMLIATGGEDRTVRLWSPFRGRDQQALLGHVGSITRLAVLDGERLVSASDDGSLRVWDRATGMPVVTHTGYPHHVNALAVTADGQRAFSSFHGSLMTTDLDAASQPVTWSTGYNWIREVQATPDGSLLVVAGTEGGSVLDPVGRRIVRTLPGHATACAISGPTAFFGFADGRVVSIVLGEEGPVTVLVEGGEWVRAMAVDSDGTLWLAAGRTVQRRDAQGGRLVWEGTSSSNLRALALLPGSSRVVTGNEDGSLVFWDARSGRPVLVLRLAGGKVTSVISDPGGRFLVAGTEDGTCHLLHATAAIAPADLLSISGTSAAMHLHARWRHQLGTRADVVALIERGSDGDPQLREWLQTCERCWLPMPWYLVQAAWDMVLEPGQPAERYADCRRVAEAYLDAVDPGYDMALVIVVLASARLGEMERALQCALRVSEGMIVNAPICEPFLCAGRALALHARGDREGANAQLARLAVLAAQPSMPWHAMSLWREVEAALKQ